MKKITYSDITLKNASAKLSFREKIETAKLLDRLQIEAIELPFIDRTQVDSLLVKSVASAVRNAAVALPVAWNAEGVDIAWAALQRAEKPRLQVSMPVSPVKMEYVCGVKPPVVQQNIADLLTKCCALCKDVEFIAEDATRADDDFLAKAIQIAVDAGVSMITINDEAGLMLPDEFYDFLVKVKSQIPENIRFGVCTSTELGLADICAVKAIQAGADTVKVCVYGGNCCDIRSLTHLMTTRSDICNAQAEVKTTEINRVANMIISMNSSDTGSARYDGGIKEDMEKLVGAIGSGDSLATVTEAVRHLGYDLSEEDYAAIYEEVQRLTRNKSVDAKELDAIVASAALQVPQAYKLVKYVINSGNVINSTAQIEMSYNGETLKGVCMGDGPIDAAFLAIEQIVGHHYELDDFRIQAATQGREAVGDALIRLRSNGKLYSGRGVSTDVIGASIRGYISALNKIVYKED
ncbi:MAG: hypothetical protein HUJ72_12935 [Blautia sp.]|nr:hypothetical protein [Blautia sp.]